MPSPLTRCFSTGLCFGAVCLLSLCLVGCGETESKTAKKQDTGRSETKKLEAASGVGYDGQALRKSVDKMLDQRDKHNADLEDAQNAND